MVCEVVDSDLEKSVDSVAFASEYEVVVLCSSAMPRSKHNIEPECT